MLPKKKSLFEDHQPHVDEILQKAMNSLLSLRIEELSRKMTDPKSRKASLEKDLLITLKSSRTGNFGLLVRIRGRACLAVCACVYVHVRVLDIGAYF